MDHSKNHDDHPDPDPDPAPDHGPDHDPDGRYYAYAPALAYMTLCMYLNIL